MTAPAYTATGHLTICSGQVGDPEKCAVCKTRPPRMPAHLYSYDKEQG